MSKLIVYGDLHGCYEELLELRKKIDPKNDDIEVCVGDIITKGRASIRTLDYLIQHNINPVLGNHEDKLLRYLKHQKTNKKNPIILDDDEYQIINQLTSKHISFLEELPLYLKFGNITIVHGGLQNHMDLEKLSKNEKQKILRIRYLDTAGNFVSFGNENKESIFWSDIYDGNQGLVIYGHEWFNKPRISKHAIGIDTGCVYGNKLSAVIFDDTRLDYKIISVFSDEF